MVFNELGNSQGSFSYITPSSDLDIDDTTLCKLLTEAHRKHADYCEPEGMSVSQSSLFVVFVRSGKSVGENVDQSIGFGVRCAVLTASFLKTSKLRKWSIEQGNLWEKTTQMYVYGPYLINRDRKLSQSVARKSVITISKQHEQKKSAEFYKKNCGVSKRIFVKLSNKV